MGIPPEIRTTGGGGGFSLPRKGESPKIPPRLITFLRFETLISPPHSLPELPPVVYKDETLSGSLPFA